ncbi:hypothetical protein C7T35_21900 [Variovorax sp. WS11]|nr:hypothetical protein C7T35_21900 [Variovorax sp. WS11]
MGGQVSVMPLDTIVALPLLRAGKIKAIAALTPTRLDSLPDVPTAAETGSRDVEVYPWLGLVAPRAARRAPRQRHLLPAWAQRCEKLSLPRGRKAVHESRHGAAPIGPRTIRRIHPRRNRTLAPADQTPRHQTGLKLCVPFQPPQPILRLAL